MKFALFTGLSGTTWDDVLALWRYADQAGWDAACVTDHFMPNTADRVGDTLECWTVLAALAAQTSRMRVGTIVSGNTYRHPALLAKMASNVDVISRGRLICGIGAGWQENEHRAYGMDFYTTRERLERLDEACRVLKALWTETKASYKGRYYRLDDAPLMPKPVQRPHPELMIGGGGEKVTLRLAAAHADHWNVWGGPATFAHKGRILEEHCAKVGRDPKQILRSSVMVLGFADDRAGVERIEQAYMKRMGADAEKARDTVLAGSASQIKDKREAASHRSRHALHPHLPIARRSPPHARSVPGRGRARVSVASQCCSSWRTVDCGPVDRGPGRPAAEALRGEPKASRAH